jgi:hypothetical protein
VKTCGKGHEYTTLRCGACRAQYLKQYYEKNKNELLKNMQQYREDNPSKIKDGQSKYYETFKSKVLAKNKAWREGNPDIVAAQKKSYYEANKPVLRANQKQYRADNPEVFKAAHAKRKATKLQQTPPWYNHADAVAIYKELKPGYHIDHIVPLQGELVSGLHWHHNLQLLPAAENIAKSNKFNPDTYIHELPLY